MQIYEYRVTILHYATISLLKNPRGDYITIISYSTNVFFIAPVDLFIQGLGAATVDFGSGRVQEVSVGSNERRVIAP